MYNREADKINPVEANNINSFFKGLGNISMLMSSVTITENDLSERNLDKMIKILDDLIVGCEKLQSKILAKQGFQ